MLKKRILIVEDEILIARDIQKKLERMGYEVCGIAVSRDEAIKLVDECHPDLIVMDIIIKGDKDGIQTALEINEKNDIPIIFLTAHSDQPTIERAMITESYGYVIKPFQEREFQIIIENAFYKYEYLKKVNNNWAIVKNLLDDIEEGVIILDKNGFVTFINKIGSEITGYSEDECISRDLFDVIKIYYNSNINEDVSELTIEDLTKKDINEIIIIDKNNNKKTINIKYREIKGKKDDFIGSYLIFKEKK